MTASSCPSVPGGGGRGRPIGWTWAQVVEAVLDNRSKAIGKPLRDLNLPPESTISVVIRDGSAFFPNGATILEPGDEVIALTRSVHEPRLRSLFFSE